MVNGGSYTFDGKARVLPRKTARNTLSILCLC